MASIFCTPPLTGTGSDGFAWQFMQNGVSLGGVQQLIFNLPPVQDPGPNPNITIIPLGIALAEVQFLDFSVSASNSDKTLFLSNPDGSAPVGTTIEIGVTVSNYVNPAGVQPTGEVLFTVTMPGGAVYQLGTASIEANGNAKIEVDSQILAQPGTVVTAHYSGDAFFSARSKRDGNLAATSLLNDVTVADNPEIPLNAQNLTVVVLGGNTSAEQRRWVNSARGRYGNSAYLITKAHNVSSLGNELATLLASSIAKLILGAHGGSDGAYLDNTFGSIFNAAALQADTVGLGKIQTAVSDGGVFEYQSCNAANTLLGKTNMRNIAISLNVSVWGADKCVSRWDDGWSTSSNNGVGIGWWVVNPSMANAQLMNP